MSDYAKPVQDARFYDEKLGVKYMTGFVNGVRGIYTEEELLGP